MTFLEADVACLLLEGRDDDSGEKLKSELKRFFPSLLFQLVAARESTNENFFRLIAMQTLTSIDGGSLLARKPEMDLLLRLARTTQIATALERVGYKDGARRILIAAGTREEVGRFVSSGRVKGGVRLNSSELSEREWGWVEEAAILASLRRA